MGPYQWIDLLAACFALLCACVFFFQLWHLKKLWRESIEMRQVMVHDHLHYHQLFHDTLHVMDRTRRQSLELFGDMQRIQSAHKEGLAKISNGHKEIIKNANSIVASYNQLSLQNKRLLENQERLQRHLSKAIKQRDKLRK